MKEIIVACIVVAVMIVLGVGSLVMLANAQSECDEKGGTLLRQPLGYACLKVEVVK